MKVVGRKQLTNKVYDRLGGALSKLVLYDALQVICEELGDKLSDGESVSVHNFGTFHTYEYGSRKNVDVTSGEARITKAFINVRFVPHKAFSDLIIKKKSFFNEVD